MDSSDNHYKASNFEGFWKPFIRIFQVLCISHYSIYRPNLRGNKLKSFAFLTYFVIFGAIHIGITIFVIRRGFYIETKSNDSYKEIPLMYYVSCLSIFGNVLTHLTSNFEAFIKRTKEEEIYRKLKEIDDIFHLKLKHTLNYKELQTKYAHQTFGIFILSTVLSMISTLIPLPIDRNYFVRPILIYAIIIVRGKGCQVSLILHTLCDMLMDLRILLKQQQLNCYRNCNESLNHGYYPVENIRYFRKIYSNIWLIKSLMSDCFGWSLISFLVQFTFDLINSSYWVYINLTILESKRMSMREYPKNKLLFIDLKHLFALSLQK